MKTENLIENAAELKSIMARETKLAAEKRSSRAIYHASVSLTKNLTVQAKARGITFFIDEPASFGGADTGPNPEEAVPAAMGQAITEALYAAFLEIPIRWYESSFKGSADLAGFYGVSERPKGFNRVVCEVTVEPYLTEG